MDKYNELAADYFARHPQSKECHITSDNRVFHTHGAAQGFTNNLTDPKIESFSRDGYEKSLAKGPDLASFDITAPDAYEAGKLLLKALNIKPASNSKENVFAAITEAQEKLNSETQE